MVEIELDSNNFYGYVAQITFYPSTGGTIYLGSYVMSPVIVSVDYPYGTFDLYFPDFNKTCQIIFPAPTPTQTATQTFTPTNTSTPTVTSTQTQTPNVTSTQTQTPTVTPTITSTNTQTPTPSVTIQLTPTATPSQTSSVTPTITNTITPTITPTNTITPTITPTNTQTPTPSVTNTGTPPITPSVTPTKSRVFYGYKIMFYAKTSTAPFCQASLVEQFVRSANPVTPGLFYCVVSGVVNVYKILSSVPSNGSYPIVVFSGGYAQCSTAYNSC